MMPYFSRKFTIVAQFDSNTKTLYASKFKIVNGSYTEPETTEYEVGVDLLGETPRLMKALRFTQLITLAQALPNQTAMEELKQWSNNNTIFSFVAVNQNTLTLRVVFCGFSDLGNKLQCMVGFEYDMTEGCRECVAGVVQSMQITENDIFVILPRKIHRIPIAKPESATKFLYPDSMTYVQYFDGQWFGVSSNNVLFVLGPDSVNAGDLVEKQYYKTGAAHLYTSLVATENYMLGVFKDSNSRQGVSVFYYMDDNFFNDPVHNKSKRLLATEVRSDSTDIPSAKNKTLTLLDYWNPQAYKIKYFQEWNGNLLMFGQNVILLLSVPPTINAPPGKKLVYQSVGTLNQTYMFDGENVIYLMPLNNNSNHCASLTSRMLRNKLKGLGMQSSHLFINDIVAGSTILSFEHLDDAELQAAGSVSVDIYFKEDRNYVKSTYSVKFKYYKASRWYWLWIPLGCILLVFLAILSLCVVKISKAVRKPTRDDSMVPASLQVDKTSPLLDSRVPDRLAPLRSPWNTN